MSANTATSRDTPATQKHTPTHTVAQQAGGVGWGRREPGATHLVLCGAGWGVGQGECIEHIMYTRSRRGKSVHQPTGTWDGHAVCFVKGRAREKGGGEAASPGQARDHPQGTQGLDGGRGLAGRWAAHTRLRTCKRHQPPDNSSRTRTDTAANKQTHPVVGGTWRSRLSGILWSI